MSNSSTPRLQLNGITKAYPGCLANDDVDFKVMPGEIHALLGENGAGKSTLVKIIYGLLKADKGVIQWEGKEVVIPSPAAARALGIGMVFQHFSLFEALTVVENIALAFDGQFDLKTLAHDIDEVSTSYGLKIDPQRPVYELSVGERQRVEIVRCLLQSPRLLVMDEPTSVLTPQEVDKLFAVLNRLSSEGVSILYISHKLDEIKALCDCATILRMGAVVGEADPQQETVQSMAQLMVGEKITQPLRSTEEAQHESETLFLVNNLSLKSDQQFGVSLENINCEVAAGEIFAIAGVAGNGQTELLAALSGESLSQAGAVQLKGLNVGGQGPLKRRKAGLTFVPEERLGHGAVPAMTLGENAFLSGFVRRKLLNHGMIDFTLRDVFAKEVCDDYNVKQSGIDNTAASLSGGNLQKFIMGREILQQPDVLIAAQPTWGVDAGAAALIHQRLLDLASKGTAVVVVSQDLDELFAISDRIAVISEGRLSIALQTRETDKNEIGLLMGGLHEHLSNTSGEQADVV